jgi:hypothetical protein
MSTRSMNGMNESFARAVEKREHRTQREFHRNQSHSSTPEDPRPRIFATKIYHADGQGQGLGQGPGQ